MRGNELLRQLRQYATANRLDFSVERNRGKGSHQTVRLGSRRSVMPNPRKELKRQTLAQILRNLGAEDLFRQNE